MENMKQIGRSSSSSSSSSSSRSSAPNIAVELFGPKESSSTPTSMFGSVFGPPPTARGMHQSTAGSSGEHNPNQAANIKQHANDPGAIGGENSNKYRQQTIHPCYLSSSIYYGGQEVYSPATNRPAAEVQPTRKKDGQDDEADGNNMHTASRGNWWQGSLYY